jgi:hypothetical protein
MSDNYEPGGDVLISEEMRERWKRDELEERKQLEQALRKRSKSPMSAEKICAALALGFIAGVFCFLILAMLEKVGN